MSWEIFTGCGRPPESGSSPAWEAIPQPPPWRAPPVREMSSRFVMTPELVEAVNAALHLRRPLLLTGLPGSGKSTLVNLIAAELELEEVLHWHVTSKSTLTDALYQYDALGRLHGTQVAELRAKAGELGAHDAEVDRYVTLGPLGTAFASAAHPRAVLVDEIDKSDLDLPGDLLNVLEKCEFDIPPLVRDTRSVVVAAAAGRQEDVIYTIQGVDRGMYTVPNGVVRAAHFPVIVFTSNGERTFPAPFLRRCIRFEMRPPDAGILAEIVTNYLGHPAAENAREVIEEFAEMIREGRIQAVDQLLGFVHLVMGGAAPETEDRKRLKALILAELK